MSHSLNCILVKRYLFIEKCIVYHKYDRYLDETNTIVCVIKRVRFQLSGTINTEDGFFGYDIFASAKPAQAMHANWRINNKHK